MDLCDNRVDFVLPAVDTLRDDINADPAQYSDRNFVDDNDIGFDLMANMVDCEPIHPFAAADHIEPVAVVFDTLSGCTYDHGTVPAVSCTNLYFRMVSMCVAFGLNLDGYIPLTVTKRQVHSNDIGSILQD